MMTSAPPVRRAPTRGVPSTAPPPRAASALMPASTKATDSVESVIPFQKSSGAPERIANEDNFNGALHSLKAFSIATALVVAGGTASVWGVKTYLGVRDVRHSSHTITALPKTHTQPHADPGVRVRDAPHASHQMAAPRLADPSRIRLGSPASAYSSPGVDVLRFRA